MARLSSKRILLVILVGVAILSVFRLFFYIKFSLLSQNERNQPSIRYYDRLPPRSLQNITTQSILTNANKSVSIADDKSRHHTPVHPSLTPAKSRPKYDFPTMDIKGVPFWYYNPASEKLNFSLEVFKDEKVDITDNNDKRLKVIVFWNDFFGSNDFGFGFGRKPFVQAGCRVNSCVITADRKRYPLSQVDAIIWHSRSQDQSLPKIRYPHTRYIFWMMEAPPHTYTNLNNYKHVFNMTFTYRRDSDIYYPHDRIFHRRQPLPLPPTPVNYAKNKTKMAAWFVSNCNPNSARDELVRALQRWISVDVYGKCGNGKLQCALSDQAECMKMVERDYKFYFAFENSLCRDYVSYKFFRALRANVVPVVWGLANYTEIAPPNSFINAFNFPSAYELAKYLRYLDANDTAYNEYFKWKAHYYHRHPWLTDAMAYCDLCEQLHKDSPPKSYDLQKWWKNDAHCRFGNEPVIQKYIKANRNKP